MHTYRHAVYAGLELSSRFSGPLPVRVSVHETRRECGGRCTCRQTGETYLPCTIARLHISRDAQHVITRAESKKTIASRPANRRSRANESEPTRPMARPRRAPGEPARNPRGDAAEPETRGVVLRPARSETLLSFSAIEGIGPDPVRFFPNF